MNQTYRGNIPWMEKVLHHSETMVQPQTFIATLPQANMEAPRTPFGRLGSVYRGLLGASMLA